MEKVVGAEGRAGIGQGQASGRVRHMGQKGLCGASSGQRYSIEVGLRECETSTCQAKASSEDWEVIEKLIVRIQGALPRSDSFQLDDSQVDGDEAAEPVVQVAELGVAGEGVELVQVAAARVELVDQAAAAGQVVEAGQVAKADQVAGPGQVAKAGQVVAPVQVAAVGVEADQVAKANQVAEPVQVAEPDQVAAAGVKAEAVELEQVVLFVESPSLPVPAWLPPAFHLVSKTIGLVDDERPIIEVFENAPERPRPIARPPPATSGAMRGILMDPEVRGAMETPPPPPKRCGVLQRVREADSGRKRPKSCKATSTTGTKQAAPAPGIEASTPAKAGVLASELVTPQKPQLKQKRAEVGSRQGELSDTWQVSADEVEVGVRFPPTRSKPPLRNDEKTNI